MAEQKDRGTPDSPGGETLTGKFKGGLAEVARRDDGVSGARALRAQEIMYTPLMVAAALTLPAVVLSEVQVSGTLATLATILNWGTWLAFAIELLVMLAVVPNRWKYLRNHPLEIVVVVLTPPFLPAALQSLRSIRLLRLLRLLKLVQYSNRVFSNEGLQFAGLLTLVTTVAGGTIFRAFEAGNQHLTEWEGVFWAFTAMTTVGSEFEATTIGGQITEVLVMIVGVSFVAMLTGAIAQRFLKPSA